MPQRPVVSRPRGMSLQTVMMLVAIMTVLVAMMTSLFTMNLNFSQTFYNGDSALNEAEAGLAAVRQKLEVDGNFGMAGEEVRGRVTRDAEDHEAWHLVTFRTMTGWPQSTNNRTGLQAAGSLGRTVPANTVHVVSTGFCRGQYRTLEALLRQPPFPIALAASGKIVSKTPLVVEGTSGTAAYEAGDEDRPGHLISNSAEGIVIERGGAGEGVKTFISGFVKSVGPVTIEKPAEVRGGVRPNADVTRIPRFDLAAFNNKGQTGVVNIVDGRMDQQVLDVMYYCGHDLLYEGSVELENAFLFVEGNLTIKGSVRGTGAIACSGNLTVEGGTTLAGTNRVALLAGGDVTLVGGGNYFQGIVYCQGNLTASTITVLGNVLVDSADPAKGKATLSDVTLVSSSETATLEFVASSSSQAKAQNDFWNPPFPLGGSGANQQNYVGINPNFGDGDDMEGWYTSTDPQDIVTRFDGQVGKLQMGSFVGTPPDAAGLVAMAQQLVQLSQQYAEAEARKESLEAELAGMDDDDPDRGRVERERDEAQQAMDAAEAAYEAQTAELAQAYVTYYLEHADKTGRYKTNGKTIDVSRTYTFDLNEFMPESETLRLTYWRVYPKRF